MIERDITKIATLLVFGAILVDVFTHGQVAISLSDSFRKLWLGGLSIVAGGSGQVQ